MGRSPCCDKVGLKKGPWTPEEDHKLLAFIQEHGHGSWRALPPKAGTCSIYIDLLYIYILILGDDDDDRIGVEFTGLQRCGKSCRLRWTNYLRPDIKRGKFSLQEEQTIIQLHALLGNRYPNSIHSFPYMWVGPTPGNTINGYPCVPTYCL